MTALIQSVPNSTFFTWYSNTVTDEELKKDVDQIGALFKEAHPSLAASPNAQIGRAVLRRYSIVERRPIRGWHKIADDLLVELASKRDKREQNKPFWESIAKIVPGGYTYKEVRDRYNFVANPDIVHFRKMTFNEEIFCDALIQEFIKKHEDVWKKPWKRLVECIKAQEIFGLGRSPGQTDLRNRYFTQQRLKKRSVTTRVDGELSSAAADIIKSFFDSPPVALAAKRPREGSDEKSPAKRTNRTPQNKGAVLSSGFPPQHSTSFEIPSSDAAAFPAGIPPSAAPFQTQAHNLYQAEGSYGGLVTPFPVRTYQTRSQAVLSDFPLEDSTSSQHNPFAPTETLSSTAALTTLGLIPSQIFLPVTIARNTDHDPSPRRKSHIWTHQQDQWLLQALKDGFNWSDIVKKLPPSITYKSAQNRYVDVIHPHRIPFASMNRAQKEEVTGIIVEWLARDYEKPLTELVKVIERSPIFGKGKGPRLNDIKNFLRSSYIRNYCESNNKHELLKKIQKRRTYVNKRLFSRDALSIAAHATTHPNPSECRKPDLFSATATSTAGVAAPPLTSRPSAATPTATACAFASAATTSSASKDLFSSPAWGCLDRQGVSPDPYLSDIPSDLDLEGELSDFDLSDVPSDTDLPAPSQNGGLPRGVSPCLG